MGEEGCLIDVMFVSIGACERSGDGEYRGQVKQSLDHAGTLVLNPQKVEFSTVVPSKTYLSCSIAILIIFGRSTPIVISVVRM